MLLKYAVSLLKKPFSHDEKGVAAVEFALVAAPFLAILLAIIELAAVFWVNGILIEAVNVPARSVLVGDSLDKEKFRSLVCNKAKAFVNCDDLLIDVRSFKTFGEIKTITLIDPKTGEVQPVTFDTGKGGDIVAVRVGYAWPLIVPVLHTLTFNLSNIPGGRRLLQATNVFKNEPFGE